MAKRSDIPAIGTLSGLRVVFSAVSLAGPFFGSMCADHGADVIWIENPTVSLDRSGDGYILAQDRRNMRSMAMNVPSPEGKEAFLKLIKETDIFLEASKPGQWDKWGLSDEAMWKVNPKLIIIHISGFGQTGVADYVKRASFDPIAQAFSLAFFFNQTESGEMFPAMPQIADFLAGYAALSMGLAAYIKMLKTGKGDSIDVCQYEMLLRCYGGHSLKEFNYPQGHPLRCKPGQHNAGSAAYNVYKCADGNSVMILAVGGSAVKNCCTALGLEFGSEDFPAKPRYLDTSPEGIKLEAKLRELCSTHTAAEVERLMNDYSVPCGLVNTPEMVLEHPHVKARESLVKAPTWDEKQEIWVSNIVPKLKNNPGKQWRRPPAYGEDTSDILEELGYTKEQINAMIESKVIKQF